MRGLLVAVASLVVSAAALSAALRATSGRRPKEALAAACLLGAALYVGTFSLAPADLWVLPARLLEPSPGADFLNGLLILALALHSLWSSVYMARGGLAGVVARLDQASSAGLSRRDLGDAGADERAVTRRLARLIIGGYLARTPRGARVLPAGSRYARLSRALGRCFGAGPGG